MSIFKKIFIIVIVAIIMFFGFEFIQLISLDMKLASIKEDLDVKDKQMEDLYIDYDINSIINEETNEGVVIYEFRTD